MRLERQDDSWLMYGKRLALLYGRRCWLCGVEHSVLLDMLVKLSFSASFLFAPVQLCIFGCVYVIYFF